MAKSKMIRVGVVGVGRGQGFAQGAGRHLGMELVAICDQWEEKLNKVGQELKVTTYTDYDKFLEHDMDAVILANYFHEHAPFAVKALQAGMHVMSETSACFTIGQGVELIEAVEKSKKTYMFAENYPYMLFNQEMRKLYQSGEMGEFQYGEGEYVHPMDADSSNSISCGYNHWRNWLPYIYYNTHALAPVMYVTDTWPKKVNGFVMAADERDEIHYGKTARRQDINWAMMLHMDNGAMVRLVGLALRGHGNWYRFHCMRGLMENMRTGNRNMVRVFHDGFDRKGNKPTERIYEPNFPKGHERAASTGHGGGDYFMNYHFAEAIRSGKPPYLDVYRGVVMSITGILGYRSALYGSNTIKIPDFRDKAQRKQFKKDHWNPNPADHKYGYPYPSVLGEIKPSAKGVAYARKIWKQCGYEGK